MAYKAQCKTALQVIQDVSKRSELMRVKHKNTFDKVDRDLLKWLEEAYEEQIDQLMYIRKAIDKFRNVQR